MIRGNSLFNYKKSYSKKMTKNNVRGLKYVITQIFSRRIQEGIYQSIEEQSTWSLYAQPTHLSLFNTLVKNIWQIIKTRFKILCSYCSANASHQKWKNKSWNLPMRVEWYVQGKVRRKGWIQWPFQWWPQSRTGGRGNAEVTFDFLVGLQ